MTDADRHALGFPSWLALYKFVVLQGYAGHEAINLALVPPPPTLLEQVESPKEPMPTVEVQVVLQELKAHAFDEVYAALPTLESLTVLLEVAQEAAERHRDAALLISYLKKQPTRT